MPPEEAMLKAAILLLAESAAYKNCPLTSMVVPAMLAPAGPGKGDPVISVKAPLEPMANTEIVPAEPFERYTKFATGETVMNLAVAGTAKGDPAISVRSPRAVSMLNTEMLADPWLRTNKNWPLGLAPSPTGLVRTGVGVMAVPTGVRMPVE